MRNIVRVSDSVRAQSCPTTPPPYKRGTSGGTASISSCVVPDCCHCCNRPPAACLNPQAGFFPPNCCDLCASIKGRIIAVITGDNPFSGTYPMGCGIATPSGNQPVQGYQAITQNFCGHSLGTFLFITAICNNTSRSISIVNDNGVPVPLLIPAQKFIFGFGINNVTTIQPFNNVCYSSGSSSNANVPVILEGTCYPINLSGVFYLWHNSIETVIGPPGTGGTGVMQKLGCNCNGVPSNSCSVLITTDMGGT